MPYQLLHTLICDDIRREDNGKEILIGMLNSTIILDRVPAILATFGVRFLIESNKTNFEGVTLKIVDPNGEDIVIATSTFSFLTAEFPGSFFYKISPMPIQHYGRYGIWLGLDEEPVIVSSFDVAPPPGPVNEVPKPKKGAKKAHRRK